MGHCTFVVFSHGYRHQPVSISHRAIHQLVEETTLFGQMLDTKTTNKLLMEFLQASAIWQSAAGGPVLNHQVGPGSGFLARWNG